MHLNFLMSIEDKALLFEAALGQSYNSVVITDADINENGPRIIYANQAFEKMTGYSINELLGKSPKMLQGPLTDKSVIEEMLACIRTGRYFEGSTVNYNKSGFPYSVEWSISPIKDALGVIQYYVSVQKNITDFIKTQNERNLLVNALNDSPDCVIITDIQNRIVFVNSGFEQLTGYKQNEVLGKQPSFLWAISLDQVSQKSKTELNDVSTHFKSQEPNQRKDNSLFYVDQSIGKIVDEKGKVTHYVSFSKDSTDRLKREVALTNMASRDSLTDLLNRRSGEQLLKHFDDEKNLTKKSLCLIMMDIDNFKKINDTYGHAVGDDILKLCSKLLKNHARKADSVIRWGGEEFLILVQNAKIKDTFEFADRLRKSIEEYTSSDVGQITASFGVAERNFDESTASLLNRADKALYKAKSDGKNLVRIAI